MYWVNLSDSYLLLKAKSLRLLLLYIKDKRNKINEIMKTAGSVETHNVKKPTRKTLNIKSLAANARQM